MARIVFTSWLALVLFAVPSFAADPTSDVATDVQTSATETMVTASLFSAALAPAPGIELTTAPAAAPSEWLRNRRRPSILPALYLGSAALQAFDTYSTLTALKRGAVEANPLMRGATSSPIAFVGIKATVTVASIVAAEQMWRGHNRVGAILVMAASNGVMAIVAAHNASVLTTLR